MRNFPYTESEISKFASQWLVSKHVLKLVEEYDQGSVPAPQCVPKCAKGAT